MLQVQNFSNQKLSTVVLRLKSKFKTLLTNSTLALKEKFTLQPKIISNLLKCSMSF